MNPLAIAPHVFGLPVALNGAGMEVQRMQKQMVFSLVLLLALPIGLSAQQPVTLSLKQAVDAALEPGGRTRVQLGRALVRQAEAQSSQARAELFPDVVSG